MRYKIDDLHDGTFLATGNGSVIPCLFDSHEAAEHGAHLSDDNILGITGSYPTYVVTLAEMVAATGGYGGGN